jgi:hypothetical protein
MCGNLEQKREICDESKEKFWVKLNSLRKAGGLQTIFLTIINGLYLTRNRNV